MAVAVVKDLLERLDNWLQANRPAYHAELAPGATLAELAELEQSLQLELPPDFKEFLAWHNGQQGSTAFLENWSLMSCADIAGCRELLGEWQADGTFDSAGWWSPDWIPFLYDYTGNHWCIDTKGHFGGVPGQILYYWHDDNSREINHANFTKWLQTVVLAAENGTYYYGQKGRDYSDYLDFSAQNNPGYPKEVFVAG